MKRSYIIVALVLFAIAIGVGVVAHTGGAVASPITPSVLVPPDWPPIPADSGQAVMGVSYDPEVAAALSAAYRNVLVPSDWPPIPR
jgi:hypothetical protein